LQRLVIRLIDRTGAVCVAQSGIGEGVAVGGSERRLDRKGGRSALDGCAVNALLAVEKRNVTPAKEEAWCECAGVRKLASVLCLKDGKP
jgi:hypothetical protein